MPVATALAPTQLRASAIQHNPQQTTIDSEYSWHDLNLMDIPTAAQSNVNSFACGTHNSRCTVSYHSDTIELALYTLHEVSAIFIMRPLTTSYNTVRHLVAIAFILQTANDIGSNAFLHAAKNNCNQNSGHQPTTFNIYSFPRHRTNDIL